MASEVTLDAARRVIAAAEKKAQEIGQPMNIAVADEGGNLVAHVRMDGAWMGSVNISINKAWTARAFDITTKDLGENSQSGNQFFGIHASNGGKVMIFAGGIPLKKGRQSRGRHRRQRRFRRTGPFGRRSGRRSLRFVAGSITKSIPHRHLRRNVSAWALRRRTWNH